MFFHLFYDVLAKVDGLGFLRVFRYPSTRIIAAAATSLLISFLLGPWFIEQLKRKQIGQTIRDDGPERHLQKQGTPTMGGSLILFALAVATLMWCDLRNTLVWLALAVTVGFGAVGFWDDYRKVVHKNTKGVSGKLRLACEFGMCFAAFTYLFTSDTLDPSVRLALQIPFVDFYQTSVHLPVWGYVLFASVVVVGTANAVNLTDGLDGLAIGPTIINAGTFLIFAYVAGVETTLALVSADGTITQSTIAEYLRIAHVDGAYELAIYCAAMLGAGIGFLWYNTYPASVFMGDVGALSLGAGIGMMAVLTKNELTLLIVGGLFVVEALSVIIQVGSYKSRGKRVFLMAPIHHHFELKGWEEPKIIVRFWLVSVLLALLALATLKVR
ncbi:MAG: phospho-N-acetylmuramoyl-pentapeptide-transferase [Deltaproteobacteria bacterium]|nr:MAG: phospho-N-acetylmuramoyl-pentapeptide-transferase [Deltaproteobacteria bacterium]